MPPGEGGGGCREPRGCGFPSKPVHWHGPPSKNGASFGIEVQPSIRGGGARNPQAVAPAPSPQHAVTEPCQGPGHPLPCRLAGHGDSAACEEEDVPHPGSLRLPGPGLLLTRLPRPQAGLAECWGQKWTEPLATVGLQSPVLSRCGRARPGRFSSSRPDQVDRGPPKARGCGRAAPLPAGPFPLRSGKRGGKGTEVGPQGGTACSRAHLVPQSDHPQPRPSLSERSQFR